LRLIRRGILAPGPPSKEAALHNMRLKLPGAHK